MRLAAMILVFASVCWSQEVVIQPDARFTKHVLLVVDLSSSMSENGRITRALNAFKTVSEQPVDEMQFGIIAFANEHLRWPGIPTEDGKVTQGWAYTTPEAIAQAETWITHIDVGAWTYGLPPILRAIQDPKDDLTIVIISDGELDLELPYIPMGPFKPKEEEEEINVPDTYAIKITEAIQKRTEKGLKPPVICCIQVKSETEEVFTRIAQLGHGGYFKFLEEK